jgi:hypothetical protein
MARLQILELPTGADDDRPPFVLVIDQYEGVDVTPGITQESRLLRYKDMAEAIGARAVLVFEETIDIPANDATAYRSGSDAGNEVTLKVGDQDVRDAIAADMHRMREANAEGGKARDKDAELRAANEWIERLNAEVEEARQWARHGYEIGQRHCGWTDHGVAPAWLTEDWPPHIDSCEHLKQAAEYDEALTRVRNLPTKPEVMNTQHPDPSAYLHGYGVAIREAKRATWKPATSEGEGETSPP